MAEHNSDIPKRPEGEDIEQGAVPNPHRGKPVPPPDAHTRPAPDADVVRPDQEEELGPVEGLMHASTVEATTEVTDDPDAENEAARLGIEAEGVEAAQIFSIMLATGVTLALAVVGVFLLVAYFSDAETVERSGAATYTELQESQNRATELLTQYGRTEDVYRIPINEAMAQVAQGYYDRQDTGVRPAPTHFNTVYLDASTDSRPPAIDTLGTSASADTTAGPAGDTAELQQPTDAAEAPEDGVQPEDEPEGR